MLPYRAIDLYISDHAIDRFIQRSGHKVKDPIKVRTIIKDYLLNVSSYDIFEGKDGNYYVKYFNPEFKPIKNKEIFFIISKDSTVMTIKPMTMSAKINMIRE